MNPFAEYVRSSAFNLQLSRCQIDALLHLNKYGEPLRVRNLQSYDALASKGIVAWVGTDLRPKARPLRITAAGVQVIKLLEVAGYCDEPA